MHERVLNVCACKHVDEVIMAAPGEITDDLLNTMNISWVVHGTWPWNLQNVLSINSIIMN